MRDLVLSIKVVFGSGECTFINFIAPESYFMSVPAPMEILQS